ncbi:hypothetical protein TKK_0009489 [Trichogramma kaykai]|uniref:HTH CENPB-type domain-containing protein n=1 Tax=Trichogramma kaykai TaxID=54128 RepID=A0ABD2X0U6_9HYME
MGPSKKSPAFTKKSRKVQNIADKVKIINLLKQGEKVAAVGRKFQISESSVRAIRDNSEKILKSAADLGSHSHLTKVIRNLNIVKMEEMLIIWIQDLIHKKIPIDTRVIRAQAMEFYVYLETKSPTNESFTASKGWFEKYKNRFRLHNVKFSGESASADHVAAENFPPVVRKLIEEKGFVPEHIFNCDETGLYWKRMPSRTYLTMEEKRAPGFKVAKDRFTLLLCANAAVTYRCKPMLVYRSENPRALIGKKKDHLPVFWKSNKTAWVTQQNFKEWFNQSFIPEVKIYLAKENLSFKVLLLLDNCKSHGDTVLLAHPNVEILFLPPNTTSLIQPMDQCVIATFKSYYLGKVLKKMLRQVNQHRACENFDSQNVVKNFWKKFSILDSIGLIEESWQEISQRTLNASWSKLLPEFDTRVTSTESQPTSYRSVVLEVVELSQELGGEGFEDLQEQEVLELVMPGSETLSTEDVEQMVQMAGQEKTILPQPEDDLEKKFYSKSIVKIIDLIQNAIDEALSQDPVMTRGLSFKHSCDSAIKIYEDLYKDYRRKIKQSRITDFLQKK